MALKQTKFEVFIAELHSIKSNHLTHDVVTDLILKHFSGTKVSLSNNFKIRKYREHLAYQLLLQGMPRSEMATVLVERLSISRNWAIHLVNKAIDKRSEELHRLSPLVSNTSNYFVGV